MVLIFLAFKCLWSGIFGPSMKVSLQIHPRFSGPTGFGNGGYLAGILASYLADCVQVRIEKPIPLLQSMHIDLESKSAVLANGETIVARASIVDQSSYSIYLEKGIPQSISYEEATKSSHHGKNERCQARAANSPRHWWHQEHPVVDVCSTNTKTVFSSVAQQGEQQQV